MKTDRRLGSYLKFAALIGTVFLSFTCAREHTNPLDPASGGVRPPTGVTARGEVGQIRLEWGLSTDPDVAGYAVYRADTPDGDYTMVAGLNSTITTGESAFYDTEIEQGETYYYRIASVSRTGAVSAQSAYVYASEEGIPPPQGISAYGRVGEVYLVWYSDPDPDLVGYAVYRADRPDGEYIMIPGISPTITTGKTVFYDTGLEQGKTYYYRIASVSRTGVVSEQSEYVFAEVQ